MRISSGISQPDGKWLPTGSSIPTRSPTPFPSARWIDLHWLFQLLCYGLYLTGGLKAVLFFKLSIVPVPRAFSAWRIGQSTMCRSRHCLPACWFSPCAISSASGGDCDARSSMATYVFLFDGRGVPEEESCPAVPAAPDTLDQFAGPLPDWAFHHWYLLGGNALSWTRGRQGRPVSRDLAPCRLFRLMLCRSLWLCRTYLSPQAFRPDRTGSPQLLLTYHFRERPAFLAPGVRLIYRTVTLAVAATVVLLFILNRRKIAVEPSPPHCRIRLACLRRGAECPAFLCYRHSDCRRKCFRTPAIGLPGGETLRRKAANPRLRGNRHGGADYRGAAGGYLSVVSLYPRTG